MGKYKEVGIMVGVNFKGRGEKISLSKCQTVWDLLHGDDNTWWTRQAIFEKGEAEDEIMVYGFIDNNVAIVLRVGRTLYST